MEELINIGALKQEVAAQKAKLQQIKREMAATLKEIHETLYIEFAGNRDLLFMYIYTVK